MERQAGWFETGMLFTASELKAFLAWLSDEFEAIDGYDNLVPLYGRWLGERDDPPGQEMEIYTDRNGDRVQRIKRHQTVAHYPPGTIKGFKRSVFDIGDALCAHNISLQEDCEKCAK